MKVFSFIVKRPRLEMPETVQEDARRQRDIFQRYSTDPDEARRARESLVDGQTVPAVDQWGKVGFIRLMSKN